MTASAYHAIAGAIPALRAVPQDAEAVASIHRIARRIHAVAVDLEHAELTRIAASLLSISDTGQVEPLLAELSAVCNQLSPDAQEADTILIVEDDRLTARVHSDMLSGAHHNVVVARDAAEAEALLRDHRVAIVILDLVLPDGDGRDLLQRIRTSAATRAVPILVLTGRAEVGIQAECFALGADALLMKPARGPVLQSMVAAMLHQATERRIEGRSDRLTGVANRVAFMEALQRAAQLAPRRARPLTVAMIDLDHFKTVNDRYGHAVGDEVLRRVAATIADRLRFSDILARWGGEEFCAFFPDTDVRGAEIALSKALAAVRDLQFAAEDQLFGVTFSAGLAVILDPSGVEPALAEADRLLYRAKVAGRNRILSIEHADNPPRPRVLFVEDDQAVADLVERILSNHGYEVTRYSHGRAAMADIEQHDFVLALLDVNLPDVSGFDLVHAIRNRRHMPDVPIVLLTGSEEETDVVRGFELGVDDYITKPFYSAELLARIDRLLHS